MVRPTQRQVSSRSAPARPARCHWPDRGCDRCSPGFRWTVRAWQAGNPGRRARAIGRNRGVGDREITSLSGSCANWSTKSFSDRACGRPPLCVKTNACGSAPAYRGISCDGGRVTSGAARSETACTRPCDSSAPGSSAASLRLRSSNTAFPVRWRRPPRTSLAASPAPADLFRA